MLTAYTRLFSAHHTETLNDAVEGFGLDCRLWEFLMEEGRKATASGVGLRAFCAVRRSNTNAGLRWTLGERLRMLREAFRL